MHRIALTIAMSWFFVVESAGGFTVAVIGPFDSQDQCFNVLTWLQGGQYPGRRFSSCWESKGPGPGATK
jgi:hypothetical protein